MSHGAVPMHRPHYFIAIGLVLYLTKYMVAHQINEGIVDTKVVAQLTQTTPVEGEQFI